MKTITKTLNVTARDIERANKLQYKNRSKNCPISLSAQRLFKNRGINSAGGYINTSDFISLIIKNEEIRDFQFRFDSGYTIKPTKFKIKVIVND